MVPEVEQRMHLAHHQVLASQKKLTRMPMKTKTIGAVIAERSARLEKTP